VTTLLAAEGLCRRYGSLVAVDALDLRLDEGERHAVIGPNGAGKTTLLDLLAGACRPDRGRITFAGRDITGLGASRRARLGIGRTHQRPAVWPSLTTLDNVMLAGWYAHRRARRRAVAVDLLERVGLGSGGLGSGGLAAAPAASLSHGQRRQLEIAMALAGAPRLLLLDEPAAGLSAAELDLLRDLLAELPRTVTVLLVEHRLDLVFALADTVTVLSEGRPVDSGTPAEITASQAVRRVYAGAPPAGLFDLEAAG